MRRSRRRRKQPPLKVRKLDSGGNPCPSWCRLDVPHWHDEIIDFARQDGVKHTEQFR